MPKDICRDAVQYGWLLPATIITISITIVATIVIILTDLMLKLVHPRRDWPSEVGKSENQKSQITQRRTIINSDFYKLGRNFPPQAYRAPRVTPFTIQCCNFGIGYKILSTVRNVQRCLFVTAIGFGALKYSICACLIFVCACRNAVLKQRTHVM